MNLNRAIIVGRLVKDPETKMLPSGQQVANFSMATSRVYKDQTGQKQEKTEFHNIVIFGKMAETASLYLKKGALALIEGHIQTRSWQDASGVKKYRTEIIADSLQLGPRPQGQGQTAPLGAGYASQSIGKSKGQSSQEPIEDQDIPIIEENDTIDVKNIPF
jgi:single-strand DNA-binding protein